MSAGKKEKAIINPKYTHNIQKNRSFPLLVIGKPFDNKHCDK